MSDRLSDFIGDSDETRSKRLDRIRRALFFNMPPLDVDDQRWLLKQIDGVVAVSAKRCKACEGEGVVGWVPCATCAGQGYETKPWSVSGSRRKDKAQ